MNASRIILALGILSLALATPRLLSARPAHNYSLEEVWTMPLGQSGAARLAVCSDGRTYIVRWPDRLEVLSPAGAVLDDEGSVPSLRYKLAIGCGAGDLLYAAGDRFVVLKWQPSDTLQLLTNVSAPLTTVSRLAVGPNGDALLAGDPRQGGAEVYLVDRRGQVISQIGDSFRELTPAVLSRAEHVWLTFDAAGGAVHRSAQGPLPLHHSGPAGKATSRRSTERPWVSARPAHGDRGSSSDSWLRSAGHRGPA